MNGQPRMSNDELRARVADFERRKAEHDARWAEHHRRTEAVLARSAALTEALRPRPLLPQLCCALVGHRLLPFPRDVFAPLRCHRCGWTST